MIQETQDVLMWYLSINHEAAILDIDFYTDYVYYEFYKSVRHRNNHSRCDAVSLKDGLVCEYIIVWDAKDFNRKPQHISNSLTFVCPIDFFSKEIVPPGCGFWECDEYSNSVIEVLQPSINTSFNYYDEVKYGIVRELTKRSCKRPYTYRDKKLEDVYISNRLSIGTGLTPSQIRDMHPELIRLERNRMRIKREFLTK